jgi:hypothetical protein
MLPTPSTPDLPISLPRKRSRSGHRHGITRMPNQLRNKSSLGSAHPVSEKLEDSLDQAELFEDIATS